MEEVRRIPSRIHQFLSSFWSPTKKILLIIDGFSVTEEENSKSYESILSDCWTYFVINSETLRTASLVLLPTLVLKSYL